MNTLKLPGAQSMRYKVPVFFTPSSSILVSGLKTIKIGHNVRIMTHLKGQ
jgi:hypothetical protein